MQYPEWIFKPTQ